MDSESCASQGTKPSRLEPKTTTTSSLSPSATQNSDLDPPSYMSIMELTDIEMGLLCSDGASTSIQLRATVVWNGAFGQVFLYLVLLCTFVVVLLYVVMRYK